MKIGTKLVGAGQPAYLIAEAGVNHNGSMEAARQLIKVAAEAGADAVKFQTFRAEDLVTTAAPRARYQVENTGTNESQFDMIKKLELPFAWHPELFAYAQECGIQFLSTPFDFDSADMLDKLPMPAFKVPSGEITNLPFLRHIASKGKPVILSTGMADLREVEQAVEALRAAGCQELAVLHCTSNYPASAERSNLKAMQTIANALNVPVGLSDHTLGIEVSQAAAALGAAVIEKHFTLDREMPGPDHKASLEPGELNAWVRGIRLVESALGDGIKQPAPEEFETRNVARRSLVARVAIPAGAKIGPEHLVCKRPGTGIPPYEWDRVEGRVAARAIAADALIRYEDLV